MRARTRPRALIVIAGVFSLLTVGALTGTVGVGNARIENQSAKAGRPGERLTTAPGCVEAPSPEAYFAGGYDDFRGGDYQRALRLNAGRTLWTFQDAFVFNGTRTVLVHNVGVIQDGDCYSLLGPSGSSWLFAEATQNERHWFWILDGYQNRDGIHLYVAEMTSNGEYLKGKVGPKATWVVTLDPVSLALRSTRRAGNPGRSLFGWSVTTDENWVYQYSWCYRQFGWTEVDRFGFDTRCTNRTYLARIPVTGDPAAAPSYWNGSGWTDDRSAAASVFGPRNTARGIANPIDVVNDDGTYRLISKPDDWWGNTVFTYHADNPAGPWIADGMKQPQLLCPDCNSYYASWVPNGSLHGWNWAIGNNHWTIPNTQFFRPTFFTRNDLQPL